MLTVVYAVGAPENGKRREHPGCRHPADPARGRRRRWCRRNRRAPRPAHWWDPDLGAHRAALRGRRHPRLRCGPGPVTRPGVTPTIGLDASIVPVGLIPGTDSLQIPDIRHVGWYQLDPSPVKAAPPCSSVTSMATDSPASSGDLGQLTPGDRITITDNTNRTRTFRVTGRKQVAKTALPAELFSRAGSPRIAADHLRRRLRHRDAHNHDNVVIVATPT